MTLLVSGISHKNAAVDLREAVALDGRLDHAYDQLKASGLFSELVLLSTCNRVEAYAVAAEGGAAAAKLKAFFESLAPGRSTHVRKALVSAQDDDMLWHLLQVASSLDSMVLGEAQILGQVKLAYEQAVAADAVGPIFHGLFQRVFSAAKQVRSETEIGQHPASIPSVAVQLAQRLFGQLEGGHVMVLGAGDMAELTAEHLVSAGVSRLRFINRSLPKAKDLAKRFKGEAGGLQDMEAALTEADVVVCSSGAPDFLIQVPQVAAALHARRQKPQLLVDISVPRNIDPAVAKLDNVYLYNLDDLDQLAAEHRERRIAASHGASAMLKQRLKELKEWMAASRVVPTVTKLSGHFEAVRANEMIRMKGKLAHLDPKDQEKIDTLTKAIVQKLLHGPVSKLKQRAAAGDKASLLVEGAEELFGLTDTEEA